MSRASGMTISLDALSEITTSHIASPDVHVDPERHPIVMYFDDLDGVGHQRIADGDLAERHRLHRPADFAMSVQSSRVSLFAALISRPNP